MRKALFLLLLTACGDTGQTRMSLDEFLLARGDANCARLARCGLFSSEVVCSQYFRAPDHRALIAAVNADKVAYDGVAATACLEALASVGCDKTQRDNREEPPACASVFRGRIADADICAFDDECRSGKCNAPTCTRDMCCLGTCAVSSQSVVGGPCEVDANCTDSFCTKAKQCASRVAEGMSCDDVRACDFGLACVGLTDLQPGNCRKLPPPGGSCPYLQCADVGSSCVDFTCLALGLPGSTCTTDAQCSPFAECDEGKGFCVETPTLGMPCDVYCGGEAWCNANVCVAPLANGEMCSADNQCASTDCIEGPIFDMCNATAVCF